MSTPHLTIRPGEPTRADATCFADCVIMAGDGILGHLFGRRAHPIHAAMFRRADNHNSYQHAFMAEVDGQLAGMICGFTREQKAEETSRTDWLYLRFARFALIRATLNSRALHPIDAFSSRIGEGDYYVHGLAVYPPFRGMELAERLLERGAERARALGGRRLVLDVAGDNEAALRAYEKFGMSQQDRSPTVQFRGRAFFLYRMVKRV
jgi:ribosomal protein S18 acetylase RimI-like enzyme